MKKMFLNKLSEKKESELQKVITESELESTKIVSEIKKEYSEKASVSREKNKEASDKLMSFLNQKRPQSTRNVSKFHPQRATLNPLPLSTLPHLHSL